MRMRASEVQIFEVEIHVDVLLITDVASVVASLRIDRAQILTRKTSIPSSETR
jgi:TATA-binding protein-associated factor Taf7